MKHVHIDPEMIECVWIHPKISRSLIYNGVIPEKFHIAHIEKRKIFVRLKPHFRKFPVIIYSMKDFTNGEIIEYLSEYKKVTGSYYNAILGSLQFLDIDVIDEKFDTSLYVRNNEKFNDFMFIHADEKVYAKIKLFI